MSKQIKLYAYAAILAFTIAQPSQAQTPDRAYDVAVSQAIGAAGLRPAASSVTEALLTQITAWLSTNFDLPASQDRPQIEFASAGKLAAMRYKGLLPAGWREDGDPAMPAAQADEVVAVYHDKTRTIFLRDSWTGTSAAEISVLVHEMVHHLQNLAKLTYDCPAAREKPAYLAQDEWLKLHGLDLETEFEIDRMTIMVSSACMR